LAFKLRRPLYALILLALSVIFMGTTFLPFLFSLLLPNEDIERVVAALKEGGTAPMDADRVVDEAKAAAGPLSKAIQIGSAYQKTYTFSRTGSHEQTRVSQTSCIYIAWFQKHQKPLLVAITLYANDAGQKAYRIGEVDAASVARQYAIPVLLFGVSLFLVIRRKSPAQAS
jgi:hypothetical protein